MYNKSTYDFYIVCKSMYGGDPRILPMEVLKVSNVCARGTKFPGHNDFCGHTHGLAHALTVCPAPLSMSTLGEYNIIDG